jgi:2,4-dienoyl-CoA reductase-like NADH-dependent reductase (Old Yellow Enzyme family)/thioredoxin reductase
MKSVLWQPVTINKMEVKNRIVMPPMVTQYGSADGLPTERTRNYYEARAKGGAGLVIVEATMVHKRGHTFINHLSLSDDKTIPAWRQLTEVIHRHGAKAAVQIHHGGRMAKSKLMGMPPVAPSPIPAPGGDMPQELTKEEIKEIVDAFAQAAARAKQAGFDGVEIHAAHAYLIHQFLSASSNKRLDEYGGSVANRARFLIEIIHAIRDAVGNDYPVWCRISAQEYGIAEGITLQESKEIVKLAQEAGIDAVHVSASGPTAPNIQPLPKFTPGVLVNLAEAIKKSTVIPVIAVGKITPELGEKLIKEGKADLIAMGRALFADPDIPNKIAEGRLEDILPCIECFSCRSDLYTPGIVEVRCVVNAAMGKEAEFRIVRAAKPKKVLVIGGGPAGMEAARIAAMRGHAVTLWEKEPRLGGQLTQAATPPYKDRIGAFNQFLQTQLKKLGVTIETKKEATPSAVTEFKPDAVIVATGIKPMVPQIPGIEKANVVYAGDVLEGKAKVGKKVIVIGGEMVGCETAEFLADKGKKVTVTRRGPEMALGVTVTLRGFLLSRLEKKGVTLLPGVRYEEITPRGLVVTTKEGEKKTIEADTIVLAAGSTPNQELYNALKDKVPEVYLIGDCAKPRTLREALAEGQRTGLAI